jgi:hypothetical protein
MQALASTPATADELTEIRKMIDGQQGREDRDDRT